MGETGMHQPESNTQLLSKGYIQAMESKGFVVRDIAASLFGTADKYSTGCITLSLLFANLQASTVP
jgi:hypothetical protein